MLKGIKEAGAFGGSQKSSSVAPVGLLPAGLAGDAFAPRASWAPTEVPTQATNFIGLAAASAMGLVYQVSSVRWFSA